MPLERGEAFACVRVNEAFRGQEEVRVPLARRAPDAAAQLVEVCESEHLGVVDNYRVRPRNVDAGFNNRRRKQDVELPALEVAHLPRERLRVHLPVGDYDARARAYLREVLLRLPDRGHAVVEEEHLSAAGDLRLYRGAHDIGQVAHDLRLDRDALARRRADEREVARPRHRQVQRPWNRRRRERQHVGGRAEPLQELLVPHAEALLLVDDYEPEVAERDLRREYRVRSDDDVAGTGRKPLECPLVCRRGLEARDGLDSYGRSVEA